MKIYELLNQPHQQVSQPGMNDEDDEQGKFDADKVDSNLQDVSNQIDDQDAQPAPMGGQPPDPPELDNQNPKPIDSALLSQIKSLPYAKTYDFDDNSPLNPLKIAAMTVEDLSYLQAKVRYKMQLLTMHDQVGMEDDKTMVFCTDLMRFINTVMHFKKSNTKSQLAASNPSPPYQQQ